MVPRRRATVYLSRMFPKAPSDCSAAGIVGTVARGAFSCRQCGVLGRCNARLLLGAFMPPPLADFGSMISSLRMVLQSSTANAPLGSSCPVMASPAPTANVALGGRLATNSRPWRR